MPLWKSPERIGRAAVVDPQRQLLGVFTDGDLRRALDADLDLKNTPVSEAMTPGGKRIAPGTLAAEAAHIMQTARVNAVVVTEQDQPLGILNMHDLMKAGCYESVQRQIISLRCRWNFDRRPSLVRWPRRTAKALPHADGLGIKLHLEAGIEAAIITGRISPMVDYRARQLGIMHTIRPR